MVSRLRAWGEEIVSAWKEAQAANQLKSEFLATTSHELRTPLNGIINCIRIVQDGYCDSKQEEREFLQQADDAAIHLLRIINDVLDISKIEAGKLSVNIETVNLRKILDEAIELHLATIERKELSLKTPAWQQDVYVTADPAKLKQVLINIVSNAVKFTDYGTISVELNDEFTPDKVGTEVRDRALASHSHRVTNRSFDLEATFENKQHNESTVDSDRVLVTVEDTGIGIDPSQQDKLFNPFVMVDGSTTRKFGGTGLGLAISRNLMELMQGEISLYSAGEGKGTTVKIWIPLAEVESDE